MAKKTAAPQNDPATLAFSAVEDALKDSVFANLDQPAATEQAPPQAEKPAAKPIPRDNSARSDR